MDYNSVKGTVPLSVLLIDTARWATSARVAIGLSGAGANVSILCPSRHPALKTKAVAKRMHFSSLHPVESLQTAIEAANPAAVIPCDDRSVQFLHELHARASKQGRSDIANLITRSLGPLDSFPIVSSRYEFLMIAREEGLRVPETYAISALDDLERLKGARGFPWVMKVDGTSGGLGVEIVGTPAEAERFFRQARKLYGTTRIIKRLAVNRDLFLLRPWWHRSKPAVIAQAHIQGLPANCAVVCWEGRLLAGIGVNVVSAEGSTGPASVVQLSDNPDLMFAAERIASRLKLSGFIGLDFIIEKGSGAAYLIEMNPRCTPPCHLQLGKQRDLIGALLAQLHGRLPRELPPVTHNDLIAYFPQAWLSSSEFLQSSFQDIPWEEPDLAEELFRPWPNRSLVYFMYQRFWNRFVQPNSASQPGRSKALSFPSN